MKNHEKIKSFEDACMVLGINPAIPDLSAMPDKFQGPALAHYKLMIINEAVNKEFLPEKHAPDVGSYFINKNIEINTYVINQFKDVFTEYMKAKPYFIQW